ncbi:Putative aliphatic sulfonates-binding protein [Paenibacillus sp. CECT 9249]|uniref:ABC transporter substrate-binding protein n=1 Tax=Paenibacillus sp. CECT 9249 TaxID=2845385 RepID=UPI001E28AF8A|nr:ABC transporter substrate-binding protein [Paenibacillus sp. CECT 9249]CAH0122343.1 Putative aliphatic sulfonates-binding protein [Paenibacillus sp. CECT 9249]
MFSTSKKAIAAVISLLLIASLAACGGSNNNNAQGAGEQPTHKLRLGYLSVMDDAQTILAYKAEIYKKHGLDVDMKLFSSGTDMIKAIVGGQLDAGVLGFTNALSWISKGSDLKIVGGAQMGYHSMLVHGDSGIESLDQLKGKSIASQKQGSTADVVLNGVVLKEAGFKRQDAQMQYVSPAVAIQSLAAGKVDSAFVFEPYSSIAKLMYPVKEIYEIGEQWPFPCMVVIASGDIVNNNRDAVDRMLDAQKEAIDMLQNDPAKAASYITKEFIQEDELKKLDGTTIPAEQVIQSAIESQTFNWAITEQDIARMQEISEMMLEQGSLEEKLDIKDALDLSWQEQVQP